VTRDIEVVYALFAILNTRFGNAPSCPPPMLIDSPADGIQPGCSKLNHFDVSMSKASIEDIPQIKRWTVHSMQHAIFFRSVP
jgi:hypothetical protein